MSDNKLNGWYWVTHGGETFPSQFIDGLSDIMDVNDDRIPAERLKVGPRIQEVQAFDPATVTVGDEVLVRAMIVAIDRDDRAVPIKVKLVGGETIWLCHDEIAGVIPAPEPPRRPDGWSADSRSLDPWHGVSDEERERRCEAARRAVAEAHRPQASGWRFASSTKESWCFLFRDGGQGFFVSCGEITPASCPATFAEAIADVRRRELTAAEAYEICRANGQGEKFCELTGYRP